MTDGAHYIKGPIVKEKIWQKKETEGRIHSGQRRRNTAVLKEVKKERRNQGREEEQGDDKK